MSLLPQINNEINSSVKTEVTLPSKTYRLKVDSTALQLQKGNKTTVSGSEIKLTDVKFTQENKTSIKVKGSTNQATRSGKNKLNPNNPTYSNSATAQFANDTITISSTATNTTPYVRWEIETPEDKIYIIRCSGILLTSKAQIVISYNNGSKWIYPGISAQYIDGIKNEKIVFSAPKDATKVGVLLYSDKEIPATETSAKYKNIIVTIDNDDMSYEDYGASPSPDYPSPIENVEGKNKFNKSNMTEATWDNGKTNTVTLLEDGRIQSTANYAQGAAKCIDIPNLKANTNYIISGKIVSSTAGNAMIIVKGYKNNTLSNIIYRQYAVGTKFELSFNSSDYEKIGISLNGNNGTLGTIYTTIFDEIQLEEGTVATPYVPYNSLEIKDIGENLLNVTATSGTYSEGVTITVNKDKSITISGTNTSTKTIFYRIAHNLVVPAGDYTLSNNNANASAYGFIFYDDGNNFPRTNISNATFTKDTTIKPYIRIDAGITINNQTIYPIILNGTYTEETIPVYKPYQEQKVDFPLSEGQKLYKDSYLASDGIHHKRKQIVFDGTENWVNWAFDSESYIGFNIDNIINYNNSVGTDIRGTASHFIVLSNTAINRNMLSLRQLGDGRRKIYVCIEKDKLNTEDLAGFKTWLSQNPVTLEYELTTEEIVSYTTEQQEAYNQLNDYELFDGINYITMLSTIPGTLSLSYYDKNNINLIKTEEDRIVGFVDNLEAVKQSIYHILSIERYAYLIYDDNYGVEFEQYIGKDFDYVNATIENTLQEALLYDLRILDVSVDNIEQIDINKVAINFTVDTIYGNLVMEVSIDV